MGITHKLHTEERGLSLIDVIVGISLLVLVFVGLFGVFKLSLGIIGLSKAKSGGLALANERMEYIRSLSYDDVGTNGGIPSGLIAQNETVNLNGISYNRRTLIQYVDSPADQLGALDETGITADFKQAKVELTWTVNGVSDSVILVSNIVPVGVESLTGGGTLRINVIDALAQGVAGASVRVINASTSPTIDTTVLSNTTGQVLIPGAPEASNYEIYVSKTGYSSAQTYSASSTNTNPNPAHYSVLAGNTTSGTFAIDLVAQKTVTTREPVVASTSPRTLDTASEFSSTASTTISSGALTLTSSSSVYDLAGVATSSAFGPSPLDGWTSFTWNRAVPTNTTASIRFYYDNGGTYELVPDAFLAGNAGGFTTSPIDLSVLDEVTHASLRVEATLTTTDTATTSTIYDWTYAFDEGPTPIPNIDFTMVGDKVIGDSVPKYSETHQTDSSGEIVLTELEWDNYTITINDGATGYDIAEICEPQPLGLNPGDTVTTDITLEPDTTNSLRVVVRADDNSLLGDASVRLYRGGYDQTATSSSCGQAFFSGLTSANDYDIDVTRTGYTNTTVNNVDVTDDVVTEVIMNP